MSAPVPRVVIEAALNGGRSRAEPPGEPSPPAEVATAAVRCAEAGAAVAHFHAQEAGGTWHADAAWYAAAIQGCRALAPDLLISLTSIRPADVAVSVVTGLLDALAGDPGRRPDLLSVNLGHIVAWEPPIRLRAGRRTVHYPNDYDDIAAILRNCRDYGIVPELGVMDIGFLSNAVALRDDGLLPARPWFLLELDSPAFGAGRQVAPSTVGNYDHLAALLREVFPLARWAAHGVGLPCYDVVRRALATGAHVRVGFEDAVQGPDGDRAMDNASLVAWAALQARSLGRAPATPAKARAVIGLA